MRSACRQDDEGNVGLAYNGNSVIVNVGNLMQFFFELSVFTLGPAKKTRQETGRNFSKAESLLDTARMKGCSIDAVGHHVCHGKALEVRFLNACRNGAGRRFWGCRPHRGANFPVRLRLRIGCHGAEAMGVIL